MVRKMKKSFKGNHDDVVDADDADADDADDASNSCRRAPVCTEKSCG